MDEMMKRLEELEKRVAALEGQVQEQLSLMNIEKVVEKIQSYSAETNNSDKTR